MKMKKIMTIVLAGMMTLLMSSAALAAEATTPAVTLEPTAAVTAAPDPYSGIGSYMAFFQCQTTTWVYRNNFDDTGAGYGTDIFDTVYNNETSAPTSTEIHDTVIDGDGEYTVSLRNISLEGSTDFNMVAISTNIPLDAGITVTAAALKYGTREITSDFVQKTDDKNYVHIMLINQYDNAMKDTVNTMVPEDGTDITVTFTVAGFGYEKTVQDEPAPTTVAAATASPVPETTTAPAAEDSDSSNTARIVIGIVIGVAVIAVIVVILLNRRKK